MPDLDHHRPQYHFLPVRNWMNDPNGLIHWKGQYHLFYQYNPLGAKWGLIHWGHAISSDLVHWRDLPLALSPTPGTGDEDGCWSGCAVNNAGIPTLVYTGNRAGKQVPCVATSADDLLVSWQKHSGNPVIAGPPPVVHDKDFRDHCIWQEDDDWYQLIGAGAKEGGGTALLYRSNDLLTWEYLQPILIGDKNSSGDVWECPDLVPLADKHVLFVSPIPLFRTIYFTGTYKDHTFTPDLPAFGDLGNYFYAPQSMRDTNGRRLMWGWLTEGRSEEACEAAGWAGVMSLPRVLSMPNDSHTLHMSPAPELALLRGKHYSLRDVEITPQSANTLGQIRGDTLEIEAEFVLDSAGEFGLKVYCGSDSSEETLIIYDPVAQQLRVERERSSLAENVQRQTQSMACMLAESETLKLHIFLDRSVIEIFANDQCCLTTRVYPVSPASQGIDLFVRESSVRLKSLNIWEMASIWADRPL